MTGFLIGGTALVAACLACLLAPLFGLRYRSMQDERADRQATNVAIYRARVAALERQMAAGQIGVGEASIEKDRLGVRLLAESDTAAALGKAGVPSGRSRVLVGTVVVTVIGATLGGYLWSGDWRAVERAGMPNVAQLIARLQAAVAKNPDDVRARLLLARAQQRRGQYADAVVNLHRINASLSTPQTVFLAAEAQARLANGESLAGPAGCLYKQLLALDPDNRDALWYLGLRAVDAGDRPQALGYWDRLLAEPLPAKARAMVKSRRDILVGRKPEL